MLRDLEVENGGDAPRIHSMDDYFMTEVEKVGTWLHFSWSLNRIIVGYFKFLFLFYVMNFSRLLVFGSALLSSTQLYT